MHSVTQNKYWERLLNLKGFELDIRELVELKNSLSYDKISISWSTSGQEERFEYAIDQCLPGLFLSSVRHIPDNVAIVDGDDKLCFWQLAHLSLHVANYLRYLNCSIDECIGLFVEPSLEQLIGVWGIIFSGAAYLALAPDYPPERLKYMIENSSMKYIFVQEKVKFKILDIISSDITLITISDVIDYVKMNAKTKSASKPRELKPENLAYIVYTSGSTGKPKGVMIEHRSIVNQMLWLNKKGFLSRDKKIIHKTSISFDAAQWEMLSVCCGTQLVISDFSINKNISKLVDDIIKNNVSLLQCVPTLLQSLVNRHKFAKCSSLSHILCGGESLTKKLALQCLDTLPNCELINVYGPTEFTCNASFYNVSIGIKKEHHEGVSIGRPVDNTEFHILDENGRSVSSGNSGELYISGIQIARGYFNQENLTNKHFFSFIPTGSNTPIMSYKTGDLAYQNMDGSFYFIGRKDTQIKIRGMRVELEEIKIELESLPLINVAAVMNKYHDVSQSILIACVELSTEGVILKENHDHQELVSILKKELARRIPDYMIPTLFVFVDVMPLTITGKIDFNKIEKIFGKESLKEKSEPKSINERVIQSIWMECLKKNSISVYDDFFSLGGDSLSAVDIIQSINNKLGSNLPLHALFEASTIEKLACLVDVNSNKYAERLVSLQPHGALSSIFCWPGLGGYPMSLRLLAEKLGKIRPFYGIQAFGLNEDERPYGSIQKLVHADITAIRNKQPRGPYVLWGYSFGTILAFEAAYQLEQLGEKVEELVLIAPGMTKGHSLQLQSSDKSSGYENKSLVSLLFSVFSRSSDDQDLLEYLDYVNDEDDFASLISKRHSGLSLDLIKRISRVVITTSESLSSESESIFHDRLITAPVKIFSAKSDQLSYFETNSNCFINIPDVAKINVPHFELLKEPGINELLSRMRMLINWM
ncbi:amino acid adenylation domain-containing protein [Xenorhabdus bovienii]|uniref:non-ribosomal peptide synthetase family protein n=1 Tax=Xenorhabdus bovienii TaxID=40576 RepID=UPI00237CA2D3|nr:amino acid adenylation domain-containing protein [Xenorhabdus bovienii]MDE1473033.1 amino acid adenylation domain-containing protein [Xenorhabdus bovienii]